MKSMRWANWPVILVTSGAFAFWITEGRPLVRRIFYAPRAIAEESRDEHQFIAVLLPRISTGGEKAAMSPNELSAVLGGLRGDGYVSLGLQDIRDLYRRHRPLPPHAILLGFGDDYPRSVELADKVLRRARMRGVLFLSGIASDSSLEQRRLLSPHALAQLIKGEGWDLGALSAENPVTIGGRPPIDFLLDSDGHRPWPVDYARYPFRLVASEFGFNDAEEDLRNLHIMQIHPEQSPAEIVRIIEESWPRDQEFADDFSGADFLTHWIVGWGNVSSSRRRLLLLPTPRQTGASVFLRGTDIWRDLVLEFELKRYQNEFWAYARYEDGGRFVRIGARNGYWYVEQKTGSRNKPTMLARSPLLTASFPAKVRFVLKGQSAIVYVNGRMQFGKALRINPNVDRGRVMLAVYDLHPRSAMAVVAAVRAQPIGSDWIALWRDPQGGFDIDGNLKELREAASMAHAISPAWVTIQSDGTVVRHEEQRDLIGSLAGFYHCRLVPLVDLNGQVPSAERTYWGLTEAVLEPDVAGLNVHVTDAQLTQPRMISFLARIRDDFHKFHRELWVTVDTAPKDGRNTRHVVDGTLEPVKNLRPGIALLRSAARR